MSSCLLHIIQHAIKQLCLPVYYELKAPRVRQRPRLDTSVFPDLQCLTGMDRRSGTATNPYLVDHACRLHHRLLNLLSIGILMTIPSVELFPINTHRADTFIHADKCCLPAVSLGCGDWHPVWLWSISGARCGAQARPCPLCFNTRGLVSPGSWVKLPSNSPRWMNRRCYMWTGCQNDFVISSSLRCLKMLTHCFLGSNVLLKVMEAFSLFFPLQTPFIHLSVRSSVRISVSPATDVYWYFLPAHSSLSGHLIWTLLWIYRLYNFI